MGKRIGRRAFVRGGVVATGAAMVVLTGCGEDAVEESADDEAPSMEADAGDVLGDESVTVLNEVAYPAPVASSDYEAREQVVDQNPLDEEFLNGLDLFASDIACYGIAQADVEDGSVNLCLSPAGLYLALAMLAQGATGNTQAQLLDALGVSDAATLAAQCGNLMRVLWSYTTPGTDGAPSVLEPATSLWVRANAPVQDAFVETATDDFYSEVYAVTSPGPQVERAMETWVADRTGSTLEPRISLDDDWLMSLVATVWFKDGWQDPFNENDTASGTFHAAMGDVACDFMTQVRTAPAVVTNTYTAAALPLGTGSQVTFVLPAEDVDARSLLAHTAGNSALFDLSGDGAEQAQVTYRVPRFSFDATLEATEVLKAMGVTDVFEEGAELGGLMEAPVAVTSVEQGTHVALNEAGVEASSYTAVQIAPTSLEPQDMPEVALTLDRPFVFRIAAPNGVALFVGLVGDPAKA